MAYAATTPAKGDELARVIAGEFAALADSGLSEKEIRQSKDQLKGGLLLSMESSGNVMSKLGRCYLSQGEEYDVEHTVEKLMAVTPEDIERLIGKLIVPESMVLAQVGPEKLKVDAKELF